MYVNFVVIRAFVMGEFCVRKVNVRRGKRANFGQPFRQLNE